MSWTDWRRSAAWRKYILTHSGYIESTDASNISPWCAFRGFTLSRALHDLMHVVHLGIAKDHIAQMLHDLCVFGFEGGGSLNDQLMRLYLKFKRWCRSHRISYTRQRFTSKSLGIKSNQYPVMQRMKAAHAKPIIHFLAHRWRRVLTLPQAQHDAGLRLRAWACYGLAKLLHVFDRGSVFLTPDEIQRAQTASQTFLLAWQELSFIAGSKGETVFKLRPKGHYLAHLMIQVAETTENPRLLCNFIFEDFMGKIIMQARAQHRTNVTPRTVELYVMHIRHRWRRGKKKS